MNNRSYSIFSKVFRIFLAIFALVFLVALGLFAVSAFNQKAPVDCWEQVNAAGEDFNSIFPNSEFSVIESSFSEKNSSGSGSAENNPPVVWIDNHPIVIETGQPENFSPSSRFSLELQAHAWDPEDGWLDNDAFMWYSGEIKSYESSLPIRSNLADLSTLSPTANRISLPYGCHIVTVFAIDSAGLSGVAKTVVAINLPNSAPIASDDIISTSLSDRTNFDVLSNDFDLERNINMDTLRIVIPPKLGNAGVKLDNNISKDKSFPYSFRLDPKFAYVDLQDDSSSGSLWYEANNVGLDSLVYEICDIGLLCDTATVHIYSGLVDCTIIGSNSDKDELITGTNSDDIICGLEGNDRIFGGLGKDTIYGGAGQDTIYGGAGQDTIYGEAGDDIIYGGAGNDKIASGPGEDIIYGGAGQDNVGTINETNISQRKDMVYQDFIDISSASEGLSPQEQVYIDQIILECEFRFSTTQVLNNCGEFASNLCLSRIALGLSRQENIDESRMVIVDFLCQAADLAEKSTFANVLSTRYGQFYNDFGHSSRVFDQFHDSLERDVQELSEFLEENAATLSEETLHKLNQLLETIIAYAEYFFRSFPLSYHDDVID